MEHWLIILGMAAVTFLPRVLPLTVINEEMMPPLVRRGLPYVPVAVLSAIVAASYIPSPDWGRYILDERLIAGIIATGVAWYTRSTGITIVVGMAILVALDALTR
jgi:branched-subunit amino acid transport protein